MVKVGVVAVLLVAICVGAWLLLRANSSGQEVLPSATTSDFRAPVLPANATAIEREDWFWQVVDASRQNAVSQQAQLRNLSRVLDSYSSSEIEIFAAEFDRVHDSAYTWELWGAAYVIAGGCSDDCFAYFRSWLISNGRDFFSAAVKHPDALADLIDPSFDETPEFEEFSYVAGEIWAQKSGREFSSMPRTETGVYSDGPAGQPFDEESDDLLTRYPKLWSRFGEQPLG